MAFENIKPTRQLAAYFAKKGITSTGAMNSAMEAIWNLVPPIEKNEAVDDADKIDVVMKYADTYFATQPGAKKKDNITSDQIADFKESATDISMQGIADIKSAASDEAVEEFENNYLDGLAAKITTVYLDKPTLAERLQVSGVKDFAVFNEITAEDWANYAKNLPTEDEQYLDKNGKPIAGKGLKFDHAANKANFDKLKKIYDEKSGPVAIAKSAANPHVCGIRVAAKDKTCIISTNQQVLAYELVDKFGGQIGDVDNENELAATIAIYNDSDKKVDVGKNVKLPKVVGQVKRLNRVFKKQQKKNAKTGEITVKELIPVEQSKLYTWTKGTAEVTVSSDISFKYLTTNKDGKTVKRVVRLKGKVPLKAYAPTEEALSNEELKALTVKIAAKKASDNGGANKSTVSSTSRSNKDIANRIDNKELVAKAHSILAVQGIMDKKNPVLYAAVTKKYGALANISK